MNPTGGSIKGKMREIRKSAVAVKNVKEAKEELACINYQNPYGYEYVVVSAAKDLRDTYNNMIGETYIFGSDESGN